MAGSLTLTCCGCSGVFTRYTSAVRNPERSYCSTQCVSDAKSVDRVCKNCAKTFRTQIGRLSGKTNSSANFCSRPCYENWLRAAPHTRPRGTSWSLISATERKKTPFCAMCGRHHIRHEVHHIVPFRLTGDNGNSNLIVLCPKHHKAVEAATLDFMKEADATPDLVSEIVGSWLRRRQAVTGLLLKKIANERRTAAA